MVMKFYTGTHCSVWLQRTTIPLMVSHRRLMLTKALPRAVCCWLLDSGGFSELGMYGEWRTTAKDYVAAVMLYMAEIGQMEGAAIQDWMCEPKMLAKTGLGVKEHQARTIASYLELKSLAPDVPFFPVLQGWQLDDYKRHVDDYADAGIDLRELPRVGLGSVCRRQHTEEIAQVVVALHRLGLNLHGFGVKLQGLEKISSHLVSADSMAWSFAARYEPPLKNHSHKNCANCMIYAELWYRKQVWPLITFNQSDYPIQETRQNVFSFEQTTPAEEAGYVEVDMVA